VDLMNTTGRAVRFGLKRRPRYVHPHSGAVVDYLMGPASFLKFTTSVAHYIVDDDQVITC
jgi:hypothetical protein